MQQYIVTNNMKKILCDCFPKYKGVIYGGNLHFLFDEKNRIDFPIIEGREKECKLRVKNFKAKLHDLFNYKSNGTITKEQNIELQKMLIELYVYELTKPTSLAAQEQHHSVFDYVPPLFDLQKTVIEDRINNKELYNGLHKYCYKAYHNCSIYSKHSLIDFKNPGVYKTQFMKMHMANKCTFDLIALPKVAIPHSRNSHVHTEFPNIKYESEYFTGTYNERTVLFYREIVTTTDMYDYKKTGNKITVSLAVCINGNPTKKVCLLRYDYNPTNPHVNRAYYSKKDNKLTLNTVASSDDFKLNYNEQTKNKYSHLHKFDENVAYLFPKKSAENMAENMLVKFNSKQELIDWFDKSCHLEHAKETIEEVKKDNTNTDTHYGE